MQQLPEALAPLGLHKQFILYKLVPSEPKTKKIPINPDTLEAFEKGQNWQDDPTKWLTFDECAVQARLLGPEYGVGFLFTENDPFFFVDLDGCWDATAQAWSPVAQEILGGLPGIALEVSQSGTGWHLIGSAKTIPPHGCKNSDHDLELYHEKRFVALTGQHTAGSASVDLTTFLPGLIGKYFEPTAFDSMDWTTEPLEGYSATMTDEELIEKALDAASAASQFGKKASFADLWTADEEKLAASYPGNEAAWDESTADCALAEHLCFWTGNNCDRVEALMWQSALVRDKWEREDYVPRTVLKAAKLTAKDGNFFSVSSIDVNEAKQRFGQGAHLVEGFQYLSGAQQLEYFQGCVYVQDLHKVLTPSGALLNAERFNATYGGYCFQIEEKGKTTRKAWEAFTESQVCRYDMAERTAFKPLLQTGEIFFEDDLAYVNTFVPINVPKQAGDAGPFLTHIKKLLPVKRDREIVLAYMAACVQHAGDKFQWCILLQGAPGNGKTLISRILEKAVGRRYRHRPNAHDLGNKFNSWLVGKLLIVVEDIKINDLDVIEILKPYITNGDGLEIQGKGDNQQNADICANFIFTANEKDAIRKIRNDRRFSIFYTSQQSAEAIEAAGMGGDYFPKLYNWLKRQNGYAIMAEYLASYEIPAELNPALECGGLAMRAPDTSSTEEAIVASLGGVEQEILEAVEEGRPGFCNGWISAKALDRLLVELRKANALNQNKRADMLAEMGYIKHPGLPYGRATKRTDLDACKPRLYVKPDHISLNIKKPGQIVDAYVKAQAPDANEPTEAARAFGGES